MFSLRMETANRRRGLRTALLAAWCAAGICTALHMAWAQTSNPFLPPQAKAQYERSRDYDLHSVLLHLKLDWSSKTFAGTVTHTLAPLRDRLGTVTFDAGADLQITSCSIDGRPARFEQNKDRLAIDTRDHPLARGKEVRVTIIYASRPPEHGRRSLNGSYGFHWILPDRFEPSRKPGFYTQGETEGNHEWVPIYDYPNDKIRSETYVEVPASWYVIGNGRLMGIQENRAAHTRTFHWKMTQPHATYLLSLAGGEMDIVRDTWAGVDLFYDVPKGERKYISASFGDTRDMLQFFSDRLGVKYPWPKYAQAAMFDFGGGMENVSATTLGEGSLVEQRNGVWPMASLNSHELSHQWFGDLVTCRDWGDIWLNEGFATFFEQLYLEHAQGKDAYDAERENALRDYLQESRRYKRPIVTNYYPSPDSMFDSHTYPKGGLVLHMLRRELGDADFFRGLGYYLRKFAYQSVDTHDLVRALDEATGRNMEPFFDQWVYKPGHPVIDYTWTYDDAKKQVNLEISQVQDTKDGTPIYALNMPYALLTGSAGVTESTVALNADKQTFTIAVSAKPDAVLIDPGHDILMERKAHTWQPGEQQAILRHAPCWLDRRDAALALLKAEPTEEEAVQIVQTVTHDPSHMLIAAVLEQPTGGRFRRRRADAPAPAALKATALRDVYRALARSREADVRAAAVVALGRLPKDGADTAMLRGLVNEKEMFSVVGAALNALAGWDADANMDVFKRALGMDSRYELLRTGALEAIAHSSGDEAASLIVESARPAHPRPVRETAVRLLGKNYAGKERVTTALVSLLKDDDPQVVRLSIESLGQRNDKVAAPPLRALARSSQDATIQRSATGIADKLEGK